MKSSLSCRLLNLLAGFALLMFAVGLNLSGVFELPGFGGGDALARKGGATGAFFTGVLAVAVAARGVHQLDSP